MSEANIYRFDCGCEFPIIGPAKESGQLPSLKFVPDKHTIKFCSRVKDLFASGKTKGVFQLEEYLGQKWSKDLKPESLEHLAALISILRPGTLKSKDSSGVSMTEHYCRRKNGKEAIEPFHDVYDEVLRDTFNILIYQEQAMALAERLVGFSKKEADDLRKAAGKKLADEMAKVKHNFIEKAKSFGVIDEKRAAQVMDWISESAMYSFNKSVIPSTIVETKERGLITISELNIGEHVNSPDGFIEVLDKFDHGELEVFEITMESGKTITCTVNHKFLCENGEILPLYEIIENNHKIICEND